jgi:hypothetical protein
MYAMMQKLFNLFVIFCFFLQSDTFQEDLFPDTAAPTPALSACDWINGSNCNPVLMSMNLGKEPSLSASNNGQSTLHIFFFHFSFLFVFFHP